MSNKFIVYAFVLIITCLCACNDGKNESVCVPNDTVVVAKINLIDTATCIYSADVQSIITANVEISYPQLYIDKEKTEALQCLFSGCVLDVSADSLSLASAFPVFMNDAINKYTDDILETYESDFDFMIEDSCELNICISPIYNDGGIVVFNKIEESKSDADKFSKHSNYYTIDLSNMKCVELKELFAEDEIIQISTLLKSQLREDMNVNTDDELVELGYYNIDNLSVNNNFYITDNGVTWNFPPRELSVVEEVQITLDYNKLSTYIPEKSLLNQFIKK